MTGKRAALERMDDQSVSLSQTEVQNGDTKESDIVIHEVGVSWSQNAKAQKRIQLSALGLWERSWSVQRGESGMRCSGEPASTPHRASARERGA